MNKNQQSSNEPKIYSTSGFKDTLASPVFYPVIVVAIVLGVTSIFGLTQNPLKLKTVVNIIHQKVATEVTVNSTLDDKYYSDFDLSTTKSRLQKETLTSKQMTDTDYVLFQANVEATNANDTLERYAFNYDVVSESFWSDLDSTSLETPEEEIFRQQREVNSIGLPLQIDRHDNLPADYDLQGKSIYALNSL